MNRACWILIGILSFSSFGTAQAEPVLRVGFGEADLTPDLGKQPVFIAGFGQNRRATAVHDPIMARAIVLDDGTSRLAFVSVDLVGLFLPVVENVRQKLPHFRYVLISATHNHEGPDTLGLWGQSPFASGVDPNYLARVEAGCLDAILQAEQRLEIVRAELGQARGPELLTDGRLPIVKEDELTAIRFIRTTGQPSASTAGVLVVWHCHPETLDSKNTELSADFVATTVSDLKAHYEAPVVYFTGVVGGLMTSLKVPLKGADGALLRDGTFTKTKAYGREVAQLARRALKTAQPLSLLPWRIQTKPVLVPMENPIYRLAGQFGILQRPVFRLNEPLPQDLFQLQPTKDFTGAIAVRTEVGYLELGEFSLGMIPGEIYPELVVGGVPNPAEAGVDFPDATIEPAIKPAMRGRYRAIIGLANDELGYFIPRRQWDEQPPFAYGRKSSQYGEINSIGPAAAGHITRAFLDLIPKP